MLGFSWSELAVVLVIAVLVIKPGDLPEIMRAAGKLIGKVKRISKDFMTSIEDAAGKDTINEFRNELERQQNLIGKITDLDGKIQDAYDINKLEDVSRNKKAEESGNV